ncbi:MAG: DNA/RNA non-specific endonuclease [Cytophagaceae bacterium]|nr:DNA/RNA non-specific endonuclease [Cytophagaceae bacterium]
MENEKMLFVPIEQIEISSQRFKNWKDSKVRPKFDLISEEVYETLKPKNISNEIIENNIIGEQENLIQRKKMLQNLGQEPEEFAYERAIGENDSVYSNFVELILEAKKKVGRIVIKNGNENLGYATGFMVSKKLLLTNWHVFKTKEEVDKSVIQFFYELDTKGNPTKSSSFLLDADTFFFNNEELDYCLVAVKNTDLNNTKKLSEIGYISLDPTLGKLGSEGEEKLNIIHHPNGDYKQLSIRENKFTKILHTSIWYESDTSQGSSGSPVFNDQWQLVALHHMGVPKKDAAGNYLDKDNKIIPKNGNKIDVNRIHWIANEGIRISVIIKHLKSELPNSEYVNDLTAEYNILNPGEQLLPTPKEDILTTQKNNVENGEVISISIPGNTFLKAGSININLSTKNPVDILADTKSFDQKDIDILAEEESLRLEKEMDYTECRGYSSSFLGSNFNIPFPELLPDYNHHVLKINNSTSSTLKYYHYSVIMNGLRKMPIISAINIDGNPKLRLDDTERVDSWIRDKRIDLDSQLNKDYYSKSGFDRGHMSRREDANWGKTAEEAKRNADLTCMYTNACPQVPGINRSDKKGLWGKLEKVILENGAIKEKGQTGKISVFSGPIFKANDPIFKGIQVPMEFFKIVIWKSDLKTLKITAFKLSQINLDDAIDYEKLAFDKNAEFKEYQCDLKHIQEVTGINFSNLFKFDTFSVEGNEISEISESILHESIIKK